MNHKICSECKKNLSVEKFYWIRSKPRPKCKSCWKKQSLAWAKTPNGREYFRKYFRKYSSIYFSNYLKKHPELLEKIRESKKKTARKRRMLGLVNKTEEYRKYSIKNPEKVKAHRMINHLIRKGEMKRSEFCEKCEIEAKTHAHHSDYNLPLMVMFLCSPCHKKAHSQ